jgi:signal transduction histidine kinase
LVRRIEGWLEPSFPPEATAAILLFTLVFLFEPLQRQVGRALRRRFRVTLDQLQRLEGEFQREARSGDVDALLGYASGRIALEFGLARAAIRLGAAEIKEQKRQPGEAAVQSLPLRDGARVLGSLEVASHGAALSGETFVALESLAGQLPAIIDLCRLIEEKLALERELGERERMALVGQMTASISHNLKNPLGSIKTILQVRLEDRNLSGDLRRDIELVLSEIERLNAKLSQLLRYSRPAVRPEAKPRVDAVALVQQTVSLLSREAERRGGRLEFGTSEEALCVAATEEELGDVISNLVVNAIEALPPGGKVRVRLERREAKALLEVSDDGPGIPLANREKIFQPFFTTKPSGTGLGLAIVERRVAELGGTIEWKSPAEDGLGTRFTVTFPLGE